MSKRGRERDEEPKATQMPTSWNLRQTVLPSVPIAVFNRSVQNEISSFGIFRVAINNCVFGRCTLHRLDDSTFLLNGIDDRDPSLTIEIQGQSGPVLYASMQDDPSSPALLLFIFETRVVVVSSITGEIVYDKPNPEATSAYLDIVLLVQPNNKCSCRWCYCTRDGRVCYCCINYRRSSCPHGGSNMHRDDIARCQSIGNDNCCCISWD